MSMQIFTGTTGMPGLLDKLNELGAFVSVEEEPGAGNYSKFVSYYVSEKSRLRAGHIAEGTTGDRWIEVRHRDSDINRCVWSSGSSASSNTHNWKIIVFDTGILFGLSTYPGTSYVALLTVFIGKTLDADGQESMGVLGRLHNNTSGFVSVTDNNPGELDIQPLNFLTSIISTKLSQVSALYCPDKFKDVFVVHLAPYKTERRFTMNGEYFYTNYYGNMAIRFGGL